jgi:hypothetical protein
LGITGKKEKNWGIFKKFGMPAGADILFLEISPPKQLGNLGSKFATKTGAGLSIKCK